MSYGVTSASEYFNDRRGLAVERGDEVAYAIRVGNTAELKVGVVQDIEVTEWETRSGYPRKDWKITVKAHGGSKPSRLEHPERIVKVRSAKEIELAEREAELRALPARLVFGDEYGQTVVEFNEKGKGRRVHPVNRITFGEAAYDA